MTYKGNTYGIITDGNVHIHYLRKDLVEDPDNQKRFADKHGKKLEFPQTWEDDLRIQQFLHNPEKDIYGSGSLRNRANGATWWYMMFYSAGGFPFDDDMNPTLNTDAGNYAVDIYLQEKKSAHPELSGWGTPQMIPRIVSGKVASCQYWDGTARLNENKEKSPTVGKWLYGVVPGSDKSGKRMHRSISSPLAAVLVNKYSPRKAQAAYLALWWATLKNSTPIVSDKVNTFHDAWHKGHMTAPIGGRELHAGRHEGDRAEHAGRQPADLSDRLPRIPGRARQEPVGSLCRPASGERGAQADRRTSGTASSTGSAAPSSRTSWRATRR